jgi:hypothetical protein
MSNNPKIRVTVEDIETGESESAVIEDDYIIVCAGSCYVAHASDYPTKGTQVLTIKGRGLPPTPDKEIPDV